MIDYPQRLATESNKHLFSCTDSESQCLGAANLDDFDSESLMWSRRATIIWKLTGWTITSMMAHSYGVDQKPQFLTGSWREASVSHDVHLSTGLLERQVV